jgi:two-component system CheB/CheR fusion protein
MDSPNGATRKRLLFVEDDEDNRESFAMVLDEKYNVFGYPCPQDALREIDSVRPDLLLLDIGMEPIDGLECLRTIRNLPGYGRVPALARTAHARTADRQRFLEGGFQGVVVKPVLDPLQLIRSIDELLIAAQDGLDETRTCSTSTAPRSRGSNGSAQT